MSTTEEQIASDIVRNLSEALAHLITANVHNVSVEGQKRVEEIDEKLKKWVDKL